MRGEPATGFGFSMEIGCRSRAEQCRSGADLSLQNRGSVDKAVGMDGFLKSVLGKQAHVRGRAGCQAPKKGHEVVGENGGHGEIDSAEVGSVSMRMSFPTRQYGHVWNPESVAV